MQHSVSIGFYESMSDQNSKLKAAGVFIDSKDIDVSRADFDLSLGKVWNDGARSEIAVSADRILFDQFIDIAARYLDPHGFSLNLENLLATIDSMRLGVFATTSSKPAADGRMIAKKVMPQVYMHLPRKGEVGPLLQRFYDEIGKYESELARLQEVESKTKKSIESAVKDESGKRAVQFLQNENDSLRSELEKLGKRLAAAEQQVQQATGQGDVEQLPMGVRSCVIRSVRTTEGTIVVKAGDSQFSVSLKLAKGVPVPNARALGFFESGVIRGLWVFDPAPTSFTTAVATVMAVDGKRVKLRFPNREEKIISMHANSQAIKVGHMIVAVFAGSFLVDLNLLDHEGKSEVVERIFDEQTTIQLATMFDRGAA
jgi:hypothetical protein